MDCRSRVTTDETGTQTPESEHSLGGRTSQPEGSGGKATEEMTPGILPSLTDSIDPWRLIEATTTMLSECTRQVEFWGNGFDG